jgi:hypothetical protein
MPTWFIITQLIITEGLPLAEAIFKKWSAGGVPTQADFDEFRAIASDSSVDRMKAALTKAGIPLDSEYAKTFLSLV